MMTTHPFTTTRSMNGSGRACRGSAPVIDLVHLSRQSMGDRDLETELLGLFARQARSIVTTLEALPATGPGHCRRSADLLHTLCGSARAIGCWDLALEAEGLESGLRTAGSPHAAIERDRLAALGDRVDLACATIDDLLGERH